ncbi:MAG: glycosyltransferase [Thermoanaerobaculia bacterium]
MLAGFVLGTLAIIGTILTSIQTLLTMRLRRRERPFAAGPGAAGSRPGDLLVSILKPVCGLDDELEQNLLSFASLHGIQYEVILSIEDRDDPALPLATTVVRDHPDVFRLIVGGGMRPNGVINRKVDRLISAASVARGEILFISDSNMRVHPDAIARTIESFTDRKVGCVSNLFIASGARDIGAVLESLHVLMFVAPGTALAATARVPCVVGKSMAISRRALQAIGGFETFIRVLAEDQAIGLAVKKAGFRLIVSPVVVNNVVVKRTVQRALDRQIRWNKIRYSFSHWLFATEVLLNPLPFAVVAAMLGSPAILLLVLAARHAQALALRRATGAALTARHILTLPLLDALMLYAWFVPFFSNRITWRGYQARIGRGTELIQAAA